MSYAQRLAAITVTTAADGSATAYSEVCTGKLSSIRYVKTDYSAGVDFTITAEATGETLWTQTNVDATVTVSPRQVTHDTAGVVAVTAILDKIALANDRIKIVIANGGNVTSGVFHVVLE
jgi:hypothetical protein